MCLKALAWLLHCCYDTRIPRTIQRGVLCQWTSLDNINRRKAMTNQGKAKNTRRGFAGMDPEERRNVASMGGKAAHRLGVAHEWTTEEARRAGRIGGMKSRRRPKNVLSIYGS
jgi:uncharacterized protein